MASLYGSKLGKNGVALLPGLEKQFPGLMDTLKASNVLVFQAIGRAHDAFVAFELPAEQQERVVVLKEQLSVLQSTNIPLEIADEIRTNGDDLETSAKLVESLPERIAEHNLHVSLVQGDLSAINDAPAQTGLDAFVETLVTTRPTTGTRANGERLPCLGHVLKVGFRNHTYAFQSISENSWQIWEFNGQVTNLVWEKESDMFPVTSASKAKKVCYVFMSGEDPTKSNVRDIRAGGIMGVSVISDNQKAWEKTTRKTNQEITNGKTEA